MKAVDRTRCRITVLVALIVVWAWTGPSAAEPGTASPAAEASADCPMTTSQLTVRGGSMAGLAEPGETITVLEGYYRCHPVARGDLVVHRFSADRDPILKSVHAIAGDTLALEPVASEAGVLPSRWHIVVNGQVVKNAAGVPYKISEKGYRMLSLYVNDYHGVIPPDTVLLLGELPDGSFDATRLGLTAVSDLIGKVVRSP